MKLTTSFLLVPKSVTLNPEQVGYQRFFRAFGCGAASSNELFLAIPPRVAH